VLRHFDRDIVDQRHFVLRHLDRDIFDGYSLKKVDTFEDEEPVQQLE